ncbi:hypothetical protein BpHYR1_004736 [Brachionus plicatilis]|uniref:Uncharacterized protein n=1 Tax=Brachionus plicatilis TaxID=10195 RepID=A0A3M7QUQ8_BRAPC|nr:hypothetical protein BpHYR1_004736 [Brachionus plicatilis]
MRLMWLGKSLSAFRFEFLQSSFSGSDNWFSTDNLERLVLQKENLINDLQDEVKEKSDKVEELNNNLEEFKRKYFEAKNFKQKAYEYETLEEKYAIIVKEKIHFEEKCKKYIKDLDDLKELRAMKEKSENEIARLTHEKSEMENRDNCHQTEFQRLRSGEEKRDQNSQIEIQLIELKEKDKNKKMEQIDKIENLTNDNAVLQNKIMMLDAEVSNLKVNHDLAIKLFFKKI